MSFAVGFIGLGLMGKPMARNLLTAGFPLTVWNRTPAKADELVQEGAKLAGDPREVAEQSDVLITIVSDPPALEEVLFEKQALAGLRSGAVLIDSSTVTPDLARKVGAACASHKVDFLDAPVTGGTWGAEKGELVFMIGGTKEVFQRVEPVLEVMGKRFFLIGPNGAGQTIKLAMNLFLAVEVQAFVEAFVLAKAAGIDGQKLIEVMQSSMGCAPLLDVKAPLLLKNEFPASFPLRLMYKDLRLAMQMAREYGVDLPAGKGTFEVYSAVKAASQDDPDYAAVARYWQKP